MGSWESIGSLRCCKRNYPVATQIGFISFLFCFVLFVFKCLFSFERAQVGEGHREGDTGSEAESAMTG